MPEPRIIDYLIRIGPHQDNARNAETIRQDAERATSGGGGGTGAGGGGGGAGGGGPSTPYQGGGSPRANVYEGSQSSGIPYTTRNPSLQTTGTSTPAGVQTPQPTTTPGGTGQRTPRTLQEQYSDIMSRGGPRNVFEEGIVAAVGNDRGNLREARRWAGLNAAQQGRDESSYVNRSNRAIARDASYERRWAGYGAAQGVVDNSEERRWSGLNAAQQARDQIVADTKERNRVKAINVSQRREEASRIRGARDTGDRNAVHEARLGSIEGKLGRGEITEIQARRESAGLWTKHGNAENRDEEKQANAAKSLEDKYHQANLRVQIEQAQIQRSLSYTAMGALEAARGFAFLGASGSESSTKILQALTKVEGAFYLMRGVTLGISSIGKIGVGIEREAYSVNRARELFQQGGGKLSKAEAASMAATEASAKFPAPMGLSLTTRMFGAAAAHPWLALGALAGTAALGGAAYAASSIGGWRFPKESLGTPLKPVPLKTPLLALEATTLQTRLDERVMGGAWQRRARGYAAARAQAAETAPTFEQREAEYDREVDISRRQAVIPSLAAAIPGMPGQEDMRRKLADAQLASKQAQDVLSNTEARLAKESKEYSDELNKTPTQVEANLARETEIKDLEQERLEIFKKDPVGLAVSSVRHYFGGSSKEEEWTLEKSRRLQQLSNTGSNVPNLNEFNEVSVRHTKALNDSTKSLEARIASGLQALQADRDYAKSLRDVASNYATAASGKAKGAAEGLYQSAVRSGGMTTQENNRLGIARNMLRGGMPTSILAGNGMLQLLQNAPDKETRMEVEAAQYRAGRQPELEQEEIRMWNTATAESLGVNERDIKLDPNIMSRLGINLNSPARSPAYLKRAEKIREFGVDPGSLRTNPVILAGMNNNPDMQMNMHLELMRVGKALENRGVGPEAVDLTRDLVGPATPGAKPGISKMPTVGGQQQITVNLDNTILSTSLTAQQSMVQKLQTVSEILGRIEKNAVERNILEADANKNAGAAGDKPQAAINWAHRTILGLS